jgi:hypothetical protein
MTSAEDLAASLVRGWTRAYTWGVPQAWAEQRRTDIESDLWEFQYDLDGPRGLTPAIQILGRLITGVGDDLLWRVEHTTWHDNVVIRRAVVFAATTVALSMLWGSSDATPRVASCPSAPRKARIDQVVTCVGAFFEPVHPR